MPHVTEEIWSFMPGERGPADRGAVARGRPSHRDEAAEAEVDAAIEAITAVRRYRDLVGVKPSAVLPARLDAGELTAQVAQLARLEPSDTPQGGTGGEPVASVPVPGGSIDLLAGPDFDPDEAGRRIEGERDRLRGEITRLEKKLGNAKFVERAPTDVVEGEREKLAEYSGALERL